MRCADRWWAGNLGCCLVSGHDGWHQAVCSDGYSRARVAWLAPRVRRLGRTWPTTPEATP